MRRAAVLSLAAGAAFAAACSDIGGPGVPVGIEALVPVPAVIQLGDTIRLRARAVDQNGDSVDAVIHWRTADTTVALDSTTGLVSGRFTGSAKLQPLAGTLVGPMVTFSVTRRADTVVVNAAAESLFVAIADSASAQLLPLVADSAGTGVANVRLILTLVAPTDGSVLLPGAKLADTVTTSGAGTPAGVVLRKVSGPPPDSALVEVEARRPSGAVVPGSGQRIRVFFEQ